MKVIFVIVGVLVVVATLFLLLSSPAGASSSSWRYEEHGRSIDIDICIRCESPIPGPPGPQGPPGEQGPQGPPGPATEPPTATISVAVEIICTEGNTPVSCEPYPVPSPQDYTIHVLAGNPTEPFQGSHVGTLVTIESGAYEVIVVEWPSGFQPGFSLDCLGSVSAEETKICTLTAIFHVGPDPIDPRPGKGRPFA